MIIPELLIKRIIDGIFLLVREDFKQQTNYKKTILYKMFVDTEYQDVYNFFKQAKELIIDNGVDKKRHIETHIMFTPDRVELPTIHVTVPSEASDEQAIGVTPRIDNDGLMTYNRRFRSNYNIMCTSNNRMEVLVMYYALRYMLISVFDTMTLFGLENPTITGQDLRLVHPNMPTGIFARGIGIAASYEVEAVVGQDIQRKINLIAIHGLAIDTTNTTTTTTSDVVVTADNEIQT